ncbi:hypothetical protein [Bernardetia sp.]|uniref:hypothetical protein n=1 Tax=Bernardetia sp. TaxID=1937974 RepID=UPI0025BEDC44|nr:hypothetical protein [Bernardetia sp.]
MKKYFIVTILISIFSCQQNTQKEKNKVETVTYEQVITDDYELEKPNVTPPKAVLVLFGGYPEKAKDIKREFKILEKARQKQIAVLYSNYSQKLWFEENELQELSNQMQEIFIKNELPTNNVYLGGFSSGGDVALLLGNYLTENKKLTPKRIFIVDSPIDLAELYFSSEKNIKRNFSETSVQESNWIISTLGERFGNPNEDLSNYEKHSVFTLKTKNINNIENLKSTKIRMYTEPDTVWWKENRMADYDQTNAYLIKNLSKELKNSGFSDVEYIPTQNKGYRANGDRHPHSWSIVDKDDLINWILK